MVIESGKNYFKLALLAFCGLALEFLLAYIVEPLLYGTQISNWSDWQTILHWIMTCTLWCFVCIGIIKFAKQKYGFDIFESNCKLKLWQIITIAAIIALSLCVSYSNWNGSKVVAEFRSNGWLRLIFQYIYYAFETALFTLILVFAQKAFEKWFRKENIPYGGLIVALTWGVSHFLTKDIVTGIFAVMAGLAFGSVYLITGRDIKKTYPILFMMFAL